MTKANDAIGENSEAAEKEEPTKWTGSISDKEDKESFIARLRKEHSTVLSPPGE